MIPNGWLAWVTTLTPQQFQQLWLIWLGLPLPLQVVSVVLLLGLVLHLVLKDVTGLIRARTHYWRAKHERPRRLSHRERAVMARQRRRS